MSLPGFKFCLLIVTWSFSFMFMKAWLGTRTASMEITQLQREGSRLRIKASGLKADRVASRKMCPRVQQCTAVMVATSCFLLESEARLHKREFTLGIHKRTATEVLALFVKWSCQICLVNVNFYILRLEWISTLVTDASFSSSKWWVQRLITGQGAENNWLEC